MMRLLLVYTVLVWFLNTVNIMGKVERSVPKCFFIFAFDIKFELVKKKFTFGPSYKDYYFTHGAKNLVQRVNASVKQLFLSSAMKKRARVYFWCVTRDVSFSSCSIFKFLRHRSQLFEVISVTSQKLKYLVSLIF